MKKEELLIYIDGSAKKGKNGSYGFVVANPKTLEIVYQEAAMIKSPLNNIFFEVLAFYKALDYVQTYNPNATAVIATDCHANIHLYQKVLNNDRDVFANKNLRQLTEKIRTLLLQDDMKHVILKKVKAHRGDYFNNYVDCLCRKARKNNQSIKQNDKFSFFNKLMEDAMKTMYSSDENMEKVNAWFEEARIGNIFAEYKPNQNPRFKKLQYIGTGEANLLHYDTEERQEMANPAAKHGVYIEEKKDGRFRVYGQRFCDYFPEHPLKPLIGREVTIFGGDIALAIQYANAKINDSQLIQRIEGVPETQSRSQRPR